MSIHYISTRGNSKPATFAEAVAQGMASDGGLFVPDEIPRIDFSKLAGKSYQEIAINTLTPYMGGFSKSEIESCVNEAYNSETFDIPEVVKTVPINVNGNGLNILELWHGPTAAFKDVALQIMPQFMRYSKIKNGDNTHTLILVATSGDTGKAALEGFKDREGVSIAVFYPDGGVSEVQRLQMVTTEGKNTRVIAVRGNFDDCQSGVKALFGDKALGEEAAGRGVKFSSANSINWGRLCPQIVYYVKSYLDLVAAGRISYGDDVDFCVPTGNFGNILAGYYAREMGLPVRRLICASNRNNVLTDFFIKGVYDKNREFYKTMSPSMDILISSNLERFLFELSGRDANSVVGWYESLAKSGNFSVGINILEKAKTFIDAHWADENTVLNAIGAIYKGSGYVMDTHTAVAVAAAMTVETAEAQMAEITGQLGPRVPIVVASTANPYKFSLDVLRGLGIPLDGTELDAVRTLSSTCAGAGAVHRAVDGLCAKNVLHDEVIDVFEMRDLVTGMVLNRSKLTSTY